MKMKFPPFLFACFLLALKSNGQALTDDFGGNSINTSLWTIYNTDIGNSSVVEGGGNATFINGAGLMTVGSFPDPAISGSFEFTGDNDDRFSIILRFDGTSFDTHWQQPSSGIQIQFAPSSNPSPNNPSLQINDLALNTQLAFAAPEIEMDTYYNFMITDSGSQIDVYLGNIDTPALFADTTASYGDTIGIFNRSQIDLGGPEHETELSNISITSVPEPTTLSIFAVSMIGIYLMRKMNKNLEA